MHLFDKGKLKYLIQTFNIPELIFFLLSSISFAIVVVIFFFLAKEGLPFLSSGEFYTFLSTRWMPVSFQKQSFGFLPLLWGSFSVTFMSLCLSVPIGLAGAIYLSEFANHFEKIILKSFIEIMAGIPSVVLGFIGIAILAPCVKEVFNSPSGLTAITGVIVLATMSIPTILTLSEDALSNVPYSYKQASLALGANRMQTLFGVILPSAVPGLISAILAGMGRIVGETMAVMMLTGNTPIISLSPLESVRTITATIAAEMGEVVRGSVHYQALFFLGLVLFVITFCINLMSITMYRRNKKRT